MRCQSLKKLSLSIVSVNFLLALAVGTLPFEAIGMEELQENELEEIEPQIVNGNPIGRGTWPEVVFLRIQVTNPFDEWNCTGTLLAQETIGTARILGFSRQDVILTAAHCITPKVSGQTVTNIRYRRDGSDPWRPPAQGWRCRNNPCVGTVRADDTALIFFDRQNDFTNGLSICEQQPTVGTQVTLVGFGCNDYPVDFTNDTCVGGGIKRRGATTIKNFPGDTFTFTGPVRNGDGNIPGLAGGDSGSPYIVTLNGSPCIAGVHSGQISFTDNNGNGRPDNGDTRTVAGANLHNNTFSRTFLTTQLLGTDCDIYEENCPARFTTLHQFLYRRQPTTTTRQTYVARLEGNLTTLGRITTEFRFSLLQPAWTMFLEQP